MIQRATSLVVLALAAASIANAQGTVVPNSYATQAGGLPFGLPFSYAAYIRHQQLIDQNQVPIGNLTGMAFRSRTPTTLVNVRDRAWQEIWVQLSSSPNSLSSMSATYAQNHGNDLKTVFNGKMDLYKENVHAPLEFNCVVPFTTPFLYVRNGPLCVDLYPQNNGYEFNTGCGGGNGTMMDFAQDQLMTHVTPAKASGCNNNPPATMAGNGTATGGYVLKLFMNGDLMPIGRACPGTGGVFPIIGSSGGGATLGNQAFKVDISGAHPSGQRAFFTIGVSNRTDSSNTRLPINLSQLGMTPAPDCWLNSDILLGVFVPLLGGKGTVPAPIPNNNSLSGLEVFTQFAVEDPGLFSFTASQSGMIRIQ